MKKSFSELSKIVVSVSCRNCSATYETDALTIELGDPYGLCADCYAKAWSHVRH